MSETMVRRPEARNDWTAHLYKILDNGKWVTVDDIVKRAGKHVPEDRAIAFQTHKRGVQTRFTHDELVAKGRRYLIRDILSREARRHTNLSECKIEGVKDPKGMWVAFRSRW